MTDRPDLRYEIKMACQEAGYSQFMMALRLHPAGISKLYPSRWVQSVYLDTLDDQALEENLAGISHREKVRYRWYGLDSEVVRGTLECKVRENSLGWKRTEKLDGDVQIEGAERGAFMRRLRELTSDAWTEDLSSSLMPVQWIRYEREYYATADKKVRITLDRNVASWDLRYRPTLSCQIASHLPNILIIEAKCAEEHYDEAQSIVARLPVQVDRCSKFVLASDQQHGPHPSLMPD